MTKRPTHPAEVNFRKWVDDWCTARWKRADEAGEPRPSADEMSREMMQELMRWIDENAVGPGE